MEANDIRSCKLYKKLRPSSAGNVVVVTLCVLFVIFLSAFGIFGVYAMIRDDISGAVVSSVIFVLLVGMIMFFSINSVRKKQKRNAGILKRLQALTYFELEELEEQIADSKLHYGTFYLLEDHFYIPSAKLMIKYSEISSWQSVIHSTNGVKDGIKLVITDNDNVKYEVWVKKWKDFYGGIMWFNDQMEQKKYIHR